AAHDLPRDIGIALMMALGGIAFDEEILPFDIAEPAQLLEERAPRSAAAGFGQEIYRNGRMEERDAGNRSLLRLRRERRGRKQQSGCEFPPPHCAHAPSTSGNA